MITRIESLSMCINAQKYLQKSVNFYKGEKI
jgi:hypothetical protein